MDNEIKEQIIKIINQISKYTKENGERLDLIIDKINELLDSSNYIIDNDKKNRFLKSLLSFTISISILILGYTSCMEIIKTRDYDVDLLFYNANMELVYEKDGEYSVNNLFGKKLKSDKSYLRVYSDWVMDEDKYYREYDLYDISNLSLGELESVLEICLDNVDYKLGRFKEYKDSINNRDLYSNIKYGIENTDSSSYIIDKSFIDEVLVILILLILYVPTEGTCVFNNINFGIFGSWLYFIKNKNMVDLDIIKLKEEINDIMTSNKNLEDKYLKILNNPNLFLYIDFIKEYAASKDIPDEFLEQDIKIKKLRIDG